jgi:hypothetical protein
MRRNSARSITGGSADAHAALEWLAATGGRYCRPARTVNGRRLAYAVFERHNPLVPTPKAPLDSAEDRSPLELVFASWQLRTDVVARIEEARELHRALQRRQQAVAAYSLAVRAAVERSARRRARSRRG